MPNYSLSLSTRTDFLNQGHLEKVVRELFPQENVISNPRKQTQFTNPKTGYFFEIDVWIPALQLGFEFQDSYHYMNTWYSHLTLDMIQKKDNNKRDAVNLAGMSLVRVPCWWDGTPESLVSTIHFERPELEPVGLVGPKDKVNGPNGPNGPISLNPSASFFPKVELPEVGSLMLASFPLDINFNHSIVSKTWWMGEKYDGVRCCWNPEVRVAYSRSGRDIPLEESIAEALPSIYVDGEFWFGRGMFSIIYSLIKGGIGESSWPSLRMISFDSPHYSFHSSPFEQRYAFLLSSIIDHPVNIVAQRMLCDSSFHLNSLIGKIIDCGGEGMILRRVGSRYERGRNHNLIKLKTSYGDKEGLVVSVDAIGVSLKLPNGQVFKVPAQNVHILSPPLSLGEIVTFSYDKLARRDIPVNAEIFRRRSDVKWEDVVASSQSHHVQESNLRSENFTAQPRGFWTLGNMREYMENFAKKLNLDPLSPSTWNKISFKSISETKGGRTILRKFKDPFTAMISIFPNIGLQNIGKFKKEIRRAWASPLKRRQFFEKFAKDNGFDALSPEAWYSQSRVKILSAKGSGKVLHYHKRKISRALMDLFPDIGLEKERFKTWSLSHPSKRRMFFENYAKENNFDPLVPENWYSQSRHKILSLKGISVIISQHYNSLAQTLFDLFPEINLEMAKLMSFSKWNSKENRRSFFEHYAQENGFDPLVAKHWYQQPKEKIYRTKGGPTVLRFHKNSVANALVELFPEVQFDKSRLFSAHFAPVRKQFLENFAEMNGFDPTDTDYWYSYFNEHILAIEGGSTILSYHNNQLSQALLDLFPSIGIQKSKFKMKAEWLNKRDLIINFAKGNKFDPLISKNWYSPQVKDKLLAAEDIKKVAYYYKNNWATAITELFPNIGLDKSILSTSWSLNLPASRKQFFLNYAQKQGFDPNIPSNWYSQPKENFSAFEGLFQVLSYHNDSLSQALLELFPDIGLDRTKLFTRSKWNYLDNRRKHFEEYAKEAGFDPLNSDSWYQQSRKNILAFKGISNVMLHYENSLSAALLDCFPNLNFQPYKFSWTPRSYNYAKYRKLFFEKFASQRGFNANSPSHWYQQSLDDILSAEGAKEVLSYHKNSVSNALLALFPDIGLDEDVLSNCFPKRKLKLL